MSARLKRWACTAALALAGVAQAQAPASLILMSDAPMDAAELFDRVSPSIWLVMTTDGSGKPLASGSAVVIAAETAVTNCHVLTGSAGVTVRNEGRQLTARRDASDEGRDLCLLTVPGLKAPAVTLAHEASLRPGMRVYAIGSPRRLEQTISDGLLSALRRGPAGDLQMVQTSAPISPGSSGGGLFDAHGRLIGITTSGLRDSQNLNFAVPARLVVELAQRGGTGRTVVVAAPPSAASAPSAPSVATPPVAAAPSRPPRAAGPSPTPAPAARPVPPAAAPAAPAAPPPADFAPEEIARQAASPKRIEYRLTDRLTGNVRPVVFARDAESAQPGTFSYNNGSWIERLNGEVIQSQPAIAGEFDAFMPPGGWAAGLGAGQASWPLRYTVRIGDRTVEMKLQVQVVEESTETLDAQSVRAILLEYRGYTQRTHSNIGTTQNQFGTYRAQVLYAPDIRRVLRFEVRTRGGTSGGAFVVNELLELVSLR